MKKLLTIVLCVLAIVCCLSISVSAANYTTSYSSYTAPSSADLAYYTGTNAYRKSSWDDIFDNLEQDFRIDKRCEQLSFVQLFERWHV